MQIIETTVLELVFSDGYGNHKISISNPKISLTSTQVEEAMDDIITNNVFSTKNGNLIAKVGAQVVRRVVSEFEID